MSPPARRICRDGSWAFSICGRQLLGRLVFSVPVLHMLLGLTSACRCSAGLEGCADAVVAARLCRGGTDLSRGLRWLRAAKRRGESGDKERRSWRSGESLQQTSPAIANHISQLQASPSVCFPLFVLHFASAVLVRVQ